MIRVWQGDITTLTVDAIVNAANESLLGGGGVDGAIHRAAGPGLLAECRKIGGCPTGQARITGGHNLPARHVIHTVGPVWHGGGQGEAALLASAYRSSLKVARQAGLRSIAFPAISTGVYRFPPDQAARIAVETIRAHGEGLEVTLVAFDAASAAVLERALAGGRDDAVGRFCGGRYSPGVCFN
ncbi:MAG: O-acetyl-ADP-ribose deacetylase [Paracoccus sp. (in: a-proteobacteria)]|uniref:O-acetyl-ADP-ribose deacetylase n=1 Tax=Paracoccus sp. TaxID=267 RepID=UPI0026DFD0E5|nr:O-acetyl-ADP-ribose deacetylase [Paracoccus sp. (in: a-proteobacteria)]MDO5631428.1 O-acetyl-ADP-ribose deacetylase [Paracoccus sp. (in: a-proteobacteria)]